MLSDQSPAKGLVFVVVLSTLIVIASLGYYFYTSQQAKREPFSTTSLQEVQTISSFGLSESDKTKIIETELSGTTLEDFEGDFRQLQQEISGL